MALKLHDERMIAVREDFDLHSEFYQRCHRWNASILELPLDVERGESREDPAEGTGERVLALRTEQLR